MLAQHFVDVEAGGDGGVVLQMPDVDHARVAGVEDQTQLARADESHRVADRRIGGHAALEVRRRGLVVGDFADQLELRDGDIAGSCGVGPGCRRTSVMRPMSSDLLAQTPRNLPTVARVSSGPLGERRR